MIYLDHAATSWPKPPQVVEAMAEYLECAGGNPGRSGHRLSIAAGRIVYETREALAELLHAPDPLRIIFTLNATHALNLALNGLLKPGDRVVTTSMEHNAVMRPLRAWEERQVELEIVPCTPEGRLDPRAVEQALTVPTRLVVVTHASNVTGTLLPVAEITRLAHHAGALVLVDAAQTAGTVPIDMAGLGIDLLAFTGHKGLQGPPGTGGLVLSDRMESGLIEPLVRGGTGSASEFEHQPEFLPDKFESGTPNGVGLAGLGAAARCLLERGVESVRAHELEMTRVLVEVLSDLPGVTVYGPPDMADRTGTVSFTVARHRVSEIGLRLDEEFGVMCRVGLHCAPAAHRTIGTFPEGTVRFAVGMTTTIQDIYAALSAVEQVTQ